MSKEMELSIIIPVSERYDDVSSLYTEYKNNIQSYTKNYEFMYVLDGPFPDAEQEIVKLRDAGEPIRLVKLTKWFGEATALSAGFEYTSGKKILTLPAYFQVAASGLPEILNKLDETDMVIAWRWPRKDSPVNRLQTNMFHFMFSKITGEKFHDLGCGVRGFRRKVINEIPVYGDQHRFLPVLASKRGFKVEEVKIEQSTRDPYTRIYKPGVYLRRMLDILTVFFLVKFTKKPLRFFGMIGSSTFILGAALLIYLAVDRLFFGIGISDRPLLLLGSLLFVLGVQIFAIGLVGELIIFTHAKDIKEYTIEEIV